MKPSHQSIAVVGLGGVFPSALTLDAFWSVIAEARSAAKEVPPERWTFAPDRFAGEPPKPDTVASRRACLVDGLRPVLDGLDLDGVPVDELDPMFQILLHAGRAAWSDAVTERLDPQRAGAIVGSIALPTESISKFSDEILDAAFGSALETALGRPAPPAALPERTTTHPLNRQVCGLPAVLLAQALGLRGFAYTLDAACASSLYAIKLAADALRHRRLDAVVCGGLSRPDSLYTQMGFSQLRALSPTGRCAPFDHRADGLVVGEGCGLLVLKRLDDALAQGDHIYGLIAEVGLSNDLGANLMSPDSEGQLRAIRDAHRRSGWRPEDIDLVECHGTGTPVGDAVEFQSMREAWGADAPAGACVMGSVKSNVGHLLTGAGAAGLIKVLLAMRHQTLPPTAHFDAAAERIALNGSPFRILKSAEPWPRRDPQRPRRAAVSAFGFGGVNAHLLVEEYLPQARSERATVHTLPASASDPTPPAVAIVGLGAHFGAFDTRERFAAQVLGDSPKAPSPPTGHWRGLALPPELQGHRVNSVEFPTARFRIPPAEIREMLPQQLIMLEVAAAALDDAESGQPPTDTDRLGMGIYVGIGLDLDTTNFHFRWNAARWLRQPGADAASAPEWLSALRQAAHPPLSANRTMGALGSIAASRLARAFRAGGPCYTVACEALSGIRALDIAVAALMDGEIDSALVGAVDFACDPRGLFADARRRGYCRHDQVRPFSADSRGTLAGEGAAALVLKRLEDAQQQGDQIYAVIRGTGASTGGARGRPDPAAYAQALETALTTSGWQPTDIDYLEAHGSGDPVEDRAEIDGLAELARRRGAPLNLHLGSAKPRIGHTGASAGLASVVKAALCLQRRTLPALNAGSSNGNSLDAPDMSLDAPATARYWLKDRAAGPRRAVVAAMGAWGDCAHLCLEQAPDSSPVAKFDPGADDGESLFVVSGATPDALIEALIALSNYCRGLPADGLRELARRRHRDAVGSSNGDRIAVGIVAADADRLQRRIERARHAVSTGQAVYQDGVFFNPRPQANAAEVAFVFPGSGNQYPAMGQALAHRFPEVMATLENENQRLASQFADARAWRPQSTPALTPKDAILGHVWFGALASDVLRSFQLRPDAVIGYSLGESTGLIATRAWSDRDELFRRVDQSTLFTDQLAGDCKAVRNVWGLSAAQQIDWRVGVVDRPAAAVQACLRGRRWVYLLIVNTPGECVIGGHREAVDEVVRSLECGFHPLEAITTVHCEVSKPVADRYRALHLLPTRAPAGMRFYSAAWGRAYDVDREAAADSILAQAVAPFDFPKVIESAYDDGVRVFIEAGPGRSATRMIQSILGDRPHAAVAAFPGSPDETGCLLRALARLATERVCLCLDPLYAGDAYEPPQSIADRMRIELAAPRFEVPPPPKPNAAVLSLAARGAATAKVAAEIPASGTAAAGGYAATAMPLVEQARRTQVAHAQAQATFLELAERQSQLIARAIDMQIRLAAASPAAAIDLIAPSAPPPAPAPAAALDRSACLEFATGNIGDVLGAGFAGADAYPTRVRLPDEPLMLVDRILEIHAEPRSLSRGRVVTEHDVLADAWYLDAGRIPTCIAVEAGQADLFLCAYLGIDFETRGLAVYRLLDARITFYGPLPCAGETIRYDIRIDGFFNQGETRLFRFAFDASVNGRPLLSMRDGCAGFFTEAELEAGKGIVQSSMDARTPAAAAKPFSALTPMARGGFDEHQLDALRQGDLAGCFGDPFARLPLTRPAGLPGGRMKLVDRILELDPDGGRYGNGIITGEADIHPDDWFLTCHFVDDQVMPGTLMYECCLHTLRVYLMRVGWVGEADEFVCEPIPEIASSLKCRGQVTALTRRVQYEISVREMGYADPDGTPYVIADALMYADNKPVVEMSNMSLRLSGLNKERLERLWSAAGGADGNATAAAAIFDSDSILAFAVGNPSDAFGAPYRIFDQSRRIARLPGPPYKFLDRITRIENCTAFVLESGGEIDAHYDVPEDAWYFGCNRQQRMPFAVLLEVALQPCGWLAAYLGSALTSEQDLSFRNLGGTGVQHRDVGADTGTLTTAVKITNVSRSGGMIIQSFEFRMRDRVGVVYTGDTYFGFFSADALKDQVGIRDASPDAPPGNQGAPAKTTRFPDRRPFPDATLRMVDDIEAYLPGGGRHGKGYIRGGINVDPDAWFFNAHFYQDPVWPGSLGVESFLQLLKFVAADRFDLGEMGDIEFECPALEHGHEWIYRGQVLPQDQRVTVHLHVVSVDPSSKTLEAEGLLSVDGRIIYEMRNFSVRIKN